MPDLYFSIDSALLRELGEKLVETVSIALAELVKNSYDADATQVEIRFQNDKGGNQQIIISDDGIGMSFDSVRNYWMRIATNNKDKKNVSSIYGRPLTGAKGIGRFSCRRLGGHLKLITTGTRSNDSRGIQRSVQRTEVEFPWAKFKPGTDVTNIKSEGEILEQSNKPTGTTLIISEIADEWGAGGLNWLKRQLAVLVANQGTRRKGFEDDPGFNVKLVVPDFESGIRDLRDDLINAGWGTLTAHINSKQQAICELNALGIGRKTITSSAKFSALKDIDLRIGIMVDVRSQLRDTSILSLGNLAKILPDWGGVQVRYRRFRVFPYGDDDWLEIDHDRGLRKGTPKDELFAFAQTLQGVDPGRSLLNLLSMRAHVGNVNIGDNADGFEMKLNREGFVSSPAVSQLKDFVRFAIDWATVLRDFYLRKEMQRESFVASKEFENIIQTNVGYDKVVDAAINYIDREVGTITDSFDDKEKNKIRTSFFRATDAIRKQNYANTAELSHLRIIASTATLVLIFSHEVRTLLGSLENSKNSLTDIKRHLAPKQSKKLSEIVEEFVELQDRLNELLELTAIVGIEQRNAKPGQVALKDKIGKIVKIFDLVVKKYSISIDYSKVANNTILANILEAEVYSIFLNVLSNAIKSVIASERSGKIEIASSRINGKNLIFVRDNGIGLSPDRYEEVFIPFISDPEGTLYDNLEHRLNPEDNLIVGTGSGLGLGIVKEIVEAHEGEINFRAPKSPWKAELEIQLP